MATGSRLTSILLRRQAIATLRRKDRVAQLFDEVAPVFKDRKGGYTRITRIGQRGGDGAEMAYLEWINFVPVAKKEPKATTPEGMEKKLDKEVKKDGAT